MADCFDAVMARAYPLTAWLKRLARRCLVSACDCDDCVQEAFLALLKSHPEWVMDDPRTKAWLAAAVRNKALELHRLRQRRPITIIDKLASVQSPDSPQELDHDGASGQPKKAFFTLQQAINTLPLDNREIVTQRVLRDLSYREIGKPMELTAAQVKSRYYRALDSLRKLLESETDWLGQHDCVNDVGGGGGEGD